MSFQVDEERTDHPHEQADPPQVPHVREDVRGIEPLLGGIHRKQLRQLLRRRLEDQPGEVVSGEQVPQGPQGLRADIHVSRLPLGEVQREVPLQVEGDPVDRLLVGEVVHLLEEGDPQHCVEVLGRRPLRLGEERPEFVDREFGEDLLPEQPRPRFLQPLPAMGAETGQRVEHVEGFVVFGEDQWSSPTFWYCWGFYQGGHVDVKRKMRVSPIILNSYETKGLFTSPSCITGRSSFST
jgi:hypothetical protein